MRPAPPSIPAEIRRTLLLCLAVPLWLTVQLCAIVLITALPAAAAVCSTDGGPPGRLTTAPGSAPPVVAGGFRWPVDGTPRPVRRFDPPSRPWLPGHRGVDLAAPPGATVRAAGPGTVLFAGPVAGRPVVTVGHTDGLRTTYEPARPTVAVGASVAAGDAVGVLLDGHPGCPVAACLHWGLRRGEDYLDPLALLGLGSVRLLPLGRHQL